MKKLLKNFFAKIVARDATPHERALAVSFGLFLSFSPLLGVQTPLLFGGSWLFGLNAAVVFAIVYLVNNPWTMIPIVVLDYFVGYWLVEKFMGIDLTPYNPSFMGWLNNKIGPYIIKYLGVTHLCLWYYIIGGLIVATIISVLSYPLVKMMLISYEHHHEDHHSK